MSVKFPDGLAIEVLSKAQDRKAFDCGEKSVNDWLQKKARQSQQKHLSATKVLADKSGTIAGFHTLAIAQVRLDQLPHKIARKLPDELLPVAILAWLGVDKNYQGQKLGDRLLADALLTCLQAAEVMPFIAVVIDCLDEKAKAFYTRRDFEEFPGHPLRLLIPQKTLAAMFESGR